MNEPEPVFVEWVKERVVMSLPDSAKAQELLCPKCGADLRDVSNPLIGAAQCHSCGRFYIWRLSPENADQK